MGGHRYNKKKTGVREVERAGGVGGNVGKGVGYYTDVQYIMGSRIAKGRRKTKGTKKDEGREIALPHRLEVRDPEGNGTWGDRALSR